MNDPIAHLGLLDDEEIELDIAALDLSALDHPGTDLAPYHALLDAIGEALAAHPEAGGDDPAGWAAALADVLHDAHGFAGDSDSYDAPLNADMIRVIDRRRGLPVSLSILHVAAARRQGWDAVALNTPFHVLVLLGGGEGGGAVITDPFHGGAIVPPERLAALLAQAGKLAEGPLDAQLDPMTNRMTLVRLLSNQASRAEQGQDVARAIVIFERITAVAPDYPQGWWDLARLQLSTHQVDAARGSLSSMLEVTRDPEHRRNIIDALGQLSGA